jgi:HEAT repeat protein
MPRETIRKLSENTERLLVAGAHLAQGSAELLGDKAALEKLIERLGAKAPPVFVRLAEQIGNVVAAKPKEQASELISLAATLAQVRGGLAQLAAPSAADTPLAAVPEIETPCNAKDLYALHDALVTSGSGRMEKIAEAVERGDVADLRLVHAVVQAMGDTYVGDTVSDKVVPAFGRAIVQPIRSKLRFPGKKVDGRRLRALVAVEKSGARGLIDQAIKEGSAEVRTAALDAIADHLPGVPGLEGVALGILEKERSGDVRRAAIRALAGYGSDASLDQLLEALDDERTAREAAEALGKSTHPQATDRVLARLDAAVKAGAAKVKKGDTAAEKDRDVARHLVRSLLGALSERTDSRIPEVARGLLEDYDTAAAHAVIRRGSADDLRVIADLLQGTDTDVFVAAVTAAMKLPEDETFARLNPLFTAKDRDTKVGKARLAALRSASFVPSGDRWVKALLGHLATTPRPEGVVALLAATKAPRAVAPLLALLEKEKKADTAQELIDALGALGDRSALPAILARLQGDNWKMGWSVRSAVVALADETTVNLVREIYAKLDAPEASNNWPIRYLLRSLERRFPGH